MTKGDGQSRHNPAQPPQRQPTLAFARPVSRSSPDEVVEAAINASGDSDAAALKFLQEVLKKAKQDANCGPVGERLDACTKFVERARKRLAKADEDLARMQNERAKLDSELAEGVGTFGRVAGRSRRGCLPDGSCRTAESCGEGSSHARCRRQSAQGACTDERRRCRGVGWRPGLTVKLHGPSSTRAGPSVLVWKPLQGQAVWFDPKMQGQVRIARCSCW